MDRKINISVITLKQVFQDKLEKYGVSKDEAADTAAIFTSNASDGILTHSVERFPRLIQQIASGIAKPGVKPSLKAEYGVIQQYDACYGLGTTTSSFAMNKACDIAGKLGAGIVAMRNANHWMRAGYYSLLAADKGKIGICWTNTMHNLASWGSKEANIGNNPVSIAVPRSTGSHFLLDSAMSQFSVGKVSQYAKEGKLLPVSGGYDKDGRLTENAEEILSSWRFLPAGYWKGSGFSILLDAMAAILSGGRTVSEIGNCDAVHETGLSQVFVAVDYEKLGVESTDRVLSSIIDSLKNAAPVDETTAIRYPGENLQKIREKSLKDGINISEKTWNEIQEL